MYCPCPYHEKKESSVLFSSNDKSDEKLDVKCTSKTHDKPTLYKCGSCNLIFSEHIKRSFEEDYSKVEDNKYIEQIPFKEKYFKLLLNKINTLKAKLVSEKEQKIEMNQCIKKIEIRKNQIYIDCNNGEFTSSYLINCAGLYADRIASLAGAKLPVRIVPFRGEYYQIKPSRENLVKGLIYPVPDPAFPFLGVHFTKRIDGTVEAGPNAVLALAREGYKKSNLNFIDFIETITYGGFLKLAKKYWKVGIGEMYRSFNKDAFTKALQELLPEIQKNDLIDGGSGVRAQAIDKNGNLIDDFSILHTERALHVCNAPSPGATSSLAIGETITNMLGKSFPNLISS